MTNLNITLPSNDIGKKLPRGYCRRVDLEISKNSQQNVYVLVNLFLVKMLVRSLKLIITDTPAKLSEKFRETIP